MIFAHRVWSRPPPRVACALVSHDTGSITNDPDYPHVCLRLRQNCGRTSFADVFRFDRIGIPSAEAIVTGWGSGEASKRAMTIDWLARIATVRTKSRPGLFEAQMRLAFVRECLLTAGVSDRSSAGSSSIRCHHETVALKSDPISCIVASITRRAYGV